jgi:hypothetical protein
MTDEQIQKLMADPGGQGMLRTELQNIEKAKARADEMAKAARDHEEASRLNNFAVQLAGDAARIRLALGKLTPPGQATGGIGDVFSRAAGDLGGMVRRP